MAHKMKMVDLGHKPMEVSPKGEKYYPSITIPLELVKGEKEIGTKVSLHVVGNIESIAEEGLRIELKKAGSMKMSEKEYLSMSDDKKDEYDEKELKDKNK